MWQETPLGPEELVCFLSPLGSRSLSLVFQAVLSVSLCCLGSGPTSSPKELFPFWILGLPQGAFPVFGVECLVGALLHQDF